MDNCNAFNNQDFNIHRDQNGNITAYSTQPQENKPVQETIKRDSLMKMFTGASSSPWVTKTITK